MFVNMKHWNALTDRQIDREADRQALTFGLPAYGDRGSLELSCSLHPPLTGGGPGTHRAGVRPHVSVLGSRGQRM